MAEPGPESRAAKEDEADQLIEGSPALKQLRWLIRIQHARVRKAPPVEGRMADMILPMASAESKLLSDLLDNELMVALKTGEMKTSPQKLTFETGEGIVENPAQAFRVILAYRRLLKMKEQVLAVAGDGQGTA